VGNPAISIPNGTDAQGLPMGLQLMGKPFGEAELLSFSKYILEGTSVGVNSPF
jgi:aspartyl-tRNA(Asn)/glutamyl-tRNA(Gln) amidotransferase subunit A